MNQIPEAPSPATEPALPAPPGQEDLLGRRSLAGLIDMVADTVRQRQQFIRKIKGLTAMGRAGAYVLVGLPFFIAAVITLMNGSYMDPLYHTSTGNKLMLLGCVMISIGSLMLKKIVSFKG